MLFNDELVGGTRVAFRLLSILNSALESQLLLIRPNLLLVFLINDLTGGFNTIMKFKLDMMHVQLV